VGDPVRFGSYELISRLGTGGMGEVWKARDARLDWIVAIKRLINHDETRFEQEARMVAALNHPNICQIYHLGLDTLVMEHIKGVPLCGPLRTDEALPLAIQIASALEEPHNKRILIVSSPRSSSRPRQTASSASQPRG
jgi:eukaryotic-like serine/threonine-protein kinase